MKILFIRPAPPDETIGLQHVMIVEPLELEILATLVEKEHEVVIIDLILENQPFSYFLKFHEPDIVCVTGYITHINSMLQICTEVKQSNPLTSTILGGVYIEKVPEVAENEYVDYRVVRNAVLSFPQLIRFIDGKSNFPAGVLKRNEIAEESLLPDYNFSVPIPNRNLTQKYRKEYFYVFHDKVALIKTSFGCPFPCSFCFCRKVAGDNYFERPMDDVIQELLAIKEKEVYIIDDNFLVSSKRVRSFIDQLIKYDIRKKYLIYGRADFIAAHPELMHELKHHGLRTVIVGFESFDDAELDILKKSTTSLTNEKAMQVLNDNGIDCYASVIAMPEWDKADFEKATRKMISLGVRFINIQPLTPLEKTDIVFDDKNLIISRSDFAKWDLAHVVVKPEKLTIQEYYTEILRMYTRILFRPANMLHHLKYPLGMQIKLLKGAFKVRKQYLVKMFENE